MRDLFVLSLKKATVIGLILFVAILGYALLSTPSEVEAQRTIVDKGDVYRVSNVAGAYRLTTSKDIQLLFAERDNDLLIGKGLEGSLPNSEKIDGTKLYLLKAQTNDLVPLSDKLVDSAFFGKSTSTVYFVTVDKELHSVDLRDNSSKRLKQKVLDPNLSPDGKFIVYIKLNQDWMPGQYYDRALGLAVLNLETGEEKLITKSWEDFDPSWTPDGTRIIFLSSMVLVDTPTTTQKISLKDHKPVPETQVVLSGSKPGENKGQAVQSVAQPINADGTPREEFGTVTIPATYIDHTTYFSINLDGTGRIRLATDAMLRNGESKPPVPSSALSWSSDGTSFVYDSDGDLWVGRLNTTVTELVAKKIGRGRNPEWANDGLITAIASDSSNSVIRIDRDGKRQ